MFSQLGLRLHPHNYTNVVILYIHLYCRCDNNDLCYAIICGEPYF